MKEKCYLIYPKSSNAESCNTKSKLPSYPTNWKILGIFGGGGRKIQSLNFDLTHP